MESTPKEAGDAAAPSAPRGGDAARRTGDAPRRGGDTAPRGGGELPRRDAGSGLACEVDSTSA
jgi:hypothetical protein